MKKKILVTIICILTCLLAGCGNTGTVTDNSVTDTDNAGSGAAVTASDPVKEPYILVTVDEFRDYYDVSSDEISDDVIERYIFDYDVTAEKMENSPIVFDEDCPPLTEEQLKEFKKEEQIKELK